MKQRINCDVSTCLYNEKEKGKCILKDLYISSLNRGSECTSSSSTICQSFQNTGGIITDNEYEISNEFMEEGDDFWNTEKEANFE